MHTTFDEMIDRVGTGCAKWDDIHAMYPDLDTDGCLAMWVADADFHAPKAVIRSLVEKAASGVYGYPSGDTRALDDAIVNWQARRHGFVLQPGAVIQAVGVVTALAVAVQALTEAGDGVIFHSPAYFPFERTVVRNERVPVRSVLLKTPAGYAIDFDDLEKKAADPKNKLFILCNPQNPTGRVLAKDELERIADICLRHNVLIFSDEIHADLILKGHKHTPIATLSKAVSDITITASSASKTFNLADLHAAYVIIPNEKLRLAYARQNGKNSTGGFSMFGHLGTQMAYTQGEAYLEALLSYIEANFDLARTLLEGVPGVRFEKPEGTFLGWFDFSSAGFEDDKALQRFIIEKAKLVGNFGPWFGAGGEGFVRLNFACPKQTVQKAMIQLKTALLAR